MKKQRSNYPMSAEERDELARELDEFGYRETRDADDADRRRFYKVEKWDAHELHVEAGIFLPFPELAAKWLQLLKQACPRFSRVAA